MSRQQTRSDDSVQPGFASRQDVSNLRRRIQRRVTLIVPPIRRAIQATNESVRRIRGGRHVIDFFHQVDDAYSHLALEAIADLADRYDVDFQFHLVGQTDRLHAPEPEMLADYARRDCGWVAPYYGIDFPKEAKRPTPDSVRRVEGLLAARIGADDFLRIASEAGRALWRSDDEALSRLTERFPATDEATTQQAINEGNALRKKRRHYSGGMFWYAGEWYWGVDRLHHLERRLIRYGANRGPNPSIRFDRPPLDPGAIPNEGQLSLDVFPSLRSPYTAMIFDRSLALAEAVDVPVSIRPVMPMVMRGVPAPAAKGLYIMLDALREAQHIGAPFGNMFDPIGRPVERGFSLWPFAREHGRGKEYISAFLRAAFVDGQETGSDSGIRAVVESAGLDFDAARSSPDSEAWREELETNRSIMYDELGVWGVPSYRLRGPDGEPDLCVWGQDRLWLVAAEIKRRLQRNA